MRHDIAASLLLTGCDFVDKVWPVISAAAGGGIIHPVETTQEGTTERYLDVYAGIDYMQITEEGLIRGIAARIQAGRSWNTFTVRERRDTGLGSELAKRTAALARPQEGYLYPAITVQAYMDSYGGEVQSVGVTRTSDLIRYCAQGEEGTHFTRRATDNATFLAVDWDVYRRLAPELLGAKPSLAWAHGQRGQGGLPRPVRANANGRRHALSGQRA